MSTLLFMLYTLLACTSLFTGLTIFIILNSKIIKISCNKDNERYIFEVIIEAFKGYKNITFMMFPAKKFRKFEGFFWYISHFCDYITYKYKPKKK